MLSGCCNTGVLASISQPPTCKLEMSQVGSNPPWKVHTLYIELQRNIYAASALFTLFHSDFSLQVEPTPFTLGSVRNTVRHSTLLPGLATRSQWGRLCGPRKLIIALFEVHVSFFSMESTQYT